MFAENIDRIPAKKPISKAFQQHFSAIARIYRNLRTTDSEPISIIVNKLKNMDSIEAVDVGCGAGRYDLLLYKNLGDVLKLTCLDTNAEMLKSLDEYLAENDIKNFITICSEAESLPFPDNTLDCVCTFNAVHHFDLPRFLSESVRILKPGGYLFIYTRLREQNKHNIWGRYFPKFNRKETRLYTLDALHYSVESVSGLAVEAIVSFAYHRRSNLDKLIQQAKARHYSTFFLYSPEEMEKAIRDFSQNIASHFEDVQQVNWFDENVLFIVQKNKQGEQRS